MPRINTTAPARAAPRTNQLESASPSLVLNFTISVAETPHRPP
jgi:hypothetical protein